MQEVANTSIEVLLDEHRSYAHIDQASDTAIITYDDELGEIGIMRLVRTVMDRGFFWLTHQYYDTDLEREVAVFNRRYTA